jgi:outer membrane receptor protein involved in Fe transport
VGWGVTTTINGGNARIRGFEFNAVRTLDFLPGFGRHLSISANGTKLDLSGPEGASFAGFIDATRNISLSWNKQPISARVTWNYRGRQRGSAYNSSGLQTGAQYGATNGFYEYYAPRYNIDVNFEYTFSRRVELFLNARNITNRAQRLERYSEQVRSAEHSRGFREEAFGVQYTLGVKGRW